jgi:glucosylceramidase
MVSIDPVSRTYRYNPEFYLMKHYSYFVGAGYKNLEVRGDYELITAFIGGNSEIVVVALNPEEDPVDLRTMINGASIVLHLEACSLNTFSIETSK